ncbi:MAG: hypothetical protein E6Q37_04750 [Crocinitomicaceae bacterium]|nr:MAG: hypothetical protein E6Q37_04750 [Crocinitomicaceae bacterium]
MKLKLIPLFVLIQLMSYAQSKVENTHFNRLQELKGTEYVVASVETWTKLIETTNRYLLFINTKTGEKNTVEFPAGGSIGTIEHVKIDALGINLVLVSTRSVDLDGKSGINWNDPTQLVILSIDGKTKTQLTENAFFARTWVINQQTGVLIITGHSDTNKNNKFDKYDLSEILMYDLKTLLKISQI